MPSAPEDLISDAALRRVFAPVLEARKLAVAVSGGADSTALMLLVHHLARIVPPFSDTLVLTVDHGLRPAGRTEAATVAVRAAALGFSHRTLEWTGDKPSANLQDAARAARYRLLAAAAAEAGCDMLLTAHTRDDQAETFVLALARGSGVYGLAAMPVSRPLGSLTLVRPLLATPRAALRAMLEAANETWSEDPSNDNPRFARTRVRREMDRLAALGLTPERLAATAETMARAAGALDATVDQVLASAATEEFSGLALRLNAQDLLRQPDEIALRALARCLRYIGGTDHVPRLDHVERLLAHLRTAVERPQAAARTLAHANAIVTAAVPGDPRTLWLAPEPGRADVTALRLAPGETGRWANRAWATLSRAAPGPCEIRFLGPSGARIALGLARLRGSNAIPRAVMAAMPGVFVDGTLMAMPTFGLAVDHRWLSVTIGRDEAMPGPPGSIATLGATPGRGLGAASVRNQSSR